MSNDTKSLDAELNRILHLSGALNENEFGFSNQRETTDEVSGYQKYAISIGDTGAFYTGKFNSNGAPHGSKSESEYLTFPEYSSAHNTKDALELLPHNVKYNVVGINGTERHKVMSPSSRVR